MPAKTDMKIPSFAATRLDSVTLFQLAARMDIPAGTLPTELGTAVTGQTFAHLRMEAAAGSGGQNISAVTRTPVSFDIVRRTVMAHIFERTTKHERIGSPSGSWV